jgi:hypothetical protein
VMIAKLRIHSWFSGLPPAGGKLGVRDRHRMGRDLCPRRARERARGACF